MEPTIADMLRAVLFALDSENDTATIKSAIREKN